MHKRGLLKLTEPEQPTTLVRHALICRARTVERPAKRRRITPLAQLGVK
jgi:hypothetical protein